jgi:hypothetical protein
MTAVAALAGALVVGVLVLAFTWPAATAKAKDLPVGIAGPSAQVDALKAAIGEQGASPFAFEPVSSRADAVARIRERRLYGAVLLGSSPEVLTSSAASAASNQALRGVASALQARIATTVESGLATRLQQAGEAVGELRATVQQLEKALAAARSGAPTGGPAAPSAPGTAAPGAGGAAGPGASTPAALPTVTVTDVVALAKDDPTGAGLNAAGFPLVLGGMLGGILVSLLVVGAARRLLALLVYGAGAGAVVTLVLQTWLHILQRDWLLNAAAIGLAMLATAALVVGCNALLGRLGIAVGAVISLLVANPISGAALPYQFLPGPWGAVGQAFVPGAASGLVRSLSYFPEADTTGQWLVLAAWAVGGLLLTAVGRFRSSAPVRLPEGELERVEPVPAAA